MLAIGHTAHYFHLFHKNMLNKTVDGKTVDS